MKPSRYHKILGYGAEHLHNSHFATLEEEEKTINDALMIFDSICQMADAREDQPVNGALRIIENQQGGELINLEFMSWYTLWLAMWQRAAKI